jgi:hypothetical protein
MNNDKQTRPGPATINGSSQHAIGSSAAFPRSPAVSGNQTLQMPSPVTPTAANAQRSDNRSDQVVLLRKVGEVEGSEWELLQLAPTSRIAVIGPTKGNSSKPATNTESLIEPKVGQVWFDGSHSPGDRCILVEHVGDTHTNCVTLRTGKTTRIRKDRMRPDARGYHYIGELELLAKVSRQLTEYHIRQAARLKPVTVAQAAASKAHVSMSNGGEPTT